MAVEKGFALYQKLIKMSYDNENFFKLLSGAYAGKLIGSSKLKTAGVCPALFNDLNRYAELDEDGVRLTQIGKAVFDTQLIVDGKAPVTPLDKVRPDGESYATFVPGIILGSGDQ